MQYAYDPSGLVSGLTYSHDGEVQGDLGYSYLPDGQPAGVTGSYANVVLPAVRGGLEYDAQNRLVETAGEALEYDADGNLLSDGSRSFVWDELGRLVSVDVAGGDLSFG
ncbi:hypothetical protein, partial [Cellulomonas dongxiuzhuiae]|uniref:hypothetical protein n=1 Tax=Cellulomonas dongxiuzhuiae TaxID=2819979 RepID=UPI001AAE4D7F